MGRCVCVEGGGTGRCGTRVGVGMGRCGEISYLEHEREGEDARPRQESCVAAFEMDELIHRDGRPRGARGDGEEEEDL